MPRALIADDDVDVRAIVRTMLSRAGHDVVEAVDGTEALQRLTAEAFDVVVLDVEMPGLSGLEVLAAARELSPPCPPVVMLSGLVSARDSSRARAAGADVYLTKPFRRTDLLDAVAGLLHPDRT